MSKRTFTDYVASSEPNVTIRTADGGSIPAHAEVLRLVCNCMKNAPASDTWDLTQLLLDGKPVTRETVTAVLEFVYDGMRVMDFEMDKSYGRFSLLQLRDMLLFADAVGCSRRILEDMSGLIKVCVRHQFEVELTADPAPGNTNNNAEATTGSTTQATTPQSIALKLSHLYSISQGHLLQRLGHYLEKKFVVSSQQQKQLEDGLSQQLHDVLAIGFKLDLPQLLKPLLSFAQQNLLMGNSPWFEHPLLDWAQWTTLFTPQLVGTTSKLASDLLAHACAQMPLGLGIGLEQLFVVDMVACDEITPVTFTAKLNEDFLDFYKDEEVDVEVDLQEGVLTIKSGDNEGMRASSCAFGVVAGPRETFDRYTQRNTLGWCGRGP